MSTDDTAGDTTPLELDQLDELLSAALDGEFDVAARDLGLSVDEAEARIRATPGADARRVTLAAARDLLAEAQPIDELLAARLRAKAVRAAEAHQIAHARERKRRRSRIAFSTAGIAAAIAAVVAVATGVTGFHPDLSSDSSSKAASSPSSTAVRELAPVPVTGAANVAALGSFADARALAVAAVQKDTVALADGERRLRESVAQPAFGTNEGQVGSADKAPLPTDQQKSAANSADSSTKSPTTTAATSTQSGTGADGSTRYDFAANPAAHCNAPPQVPTGATPVLRATATLAGKPVVVLVFASASEHVVVIEDLDCKLLNLQMLD